MVDGRGPMKNLVFCALAVILTASCGTSRVIGNIFGSSELIGSLPAIQNPEETAEIYVIRGSQFAGAARQAFIQVDGDPLFKITTGHYTIFKVSADEYNREHSLGLSFSRKSKNVVIENVFCEPGKKYYFLISIKFKQIDEANAIELMNKSIFFELKKGRD